jgi:hypothetical protein
MQITFMRGATYSYEGVSNEDYIGIVSAHSAGSYFNENIKGKYQFKKL